MIEVKIAKTKEELDDAFRIRFQVFAGEGYLDTSKYPDSREKDEFDDLSTTTNFLVLNNGKSIGTVRLLEPNQMIAERESWDIGISMENLFDLSYYREHGIHIAEIPRSSLLKEYRGTAAMMHLWGEAVRYARSKGINYFCAVGNTETDDAIEASILYHNLLQRNMVHPEIKTPPKTRIAKSSPAMHHIYGEDSIAKLDLNNLEGNRLSELEIPTTLNLFLRLGLRVTGEPAYTPIFDRFEIPLFYNLVNGMTPIAKRYFM